MKKIKLNILKKKICARIIQNKWKSNDDYY